MWEKLKLIYRKEIIPDINHFFLVGAVSIFTLLRLPSLFEPDWYGDEGIYQVIGRAMNQGRLLYRDIWDNKPPILYIYYSLVNGDLFWIRLLSLIFGAASVVVFYFVAKSIFTKSRFAVIFSTLAYSIIFGLPLLEGNIANAENFMLFPILLSLFLILKLNSKSKIWIPLFSGLFLSVAFLTKIVAIFDFAAFVLILFILRFYNRPLVDVRHHILSSPKQFFTVLKQECIFVIAFVAPIFLTFIYFIFTGAIGDYIKASFSQNVGYVGYHNYFIIPQGLLIAKLILLLIAVSLVLIFRKRIGVAGIVIYTWLILGLFSAFFSGRPYTHYVLMLLPAFCLMLGLIFAENKYRIANILGLIFLIALLRTQFTYYNNIVPYYKNYADFLANKKSIDKYQAFFDGDTPRNYEIARFIQTNTNNDEGVFLLSDSSTIYYLADKLPPGRYIVEYHISFYKDGIDETKQALDNKRPKYIITTKEGLLSNFVGGYTKKYIIQGVNIYERDN